MNIRELIIDNLVNELNKNKVKLFTELELAGKYEDGRINSIAGEEIVSQFADQITSNIRNILSRAPPRHWYDYGNEDFPINFKITTGIGADNASSKKGLYFALTGHSPLKLNERWDTYFNAFYAGIENSASNILDKDYYYIVFNKKTKDIYWTSCRQLYKLGTPNGSNLPFQIPWAHQKIRVARSLDEARKFLMPPFKEALIKSNKPLLEYNKHEWPW